MKRKTLTLVLAIMLLLSISASAIYARSNMVAPYLSFSDGNADCVLTVVAEDPEDVITAEIRLYRGIIRKKKWTVEAVGYLDFQESVSAVTGATYTLEADVTVGTDEFPTASVERTND